ncbi:MAG TPA: dihydroneopterin aldolase [Chitinophagaceae bacterium]|nr:dihydroneopterin aldolase [Chitinophagaceae bacterium]
MIQVHLHDLHFHAFHGIHPEEKILGNEYIVNVTAELHEAADVIHSIDDTVDYADLYNIVLERMNVPAPLLETVIMEIGNEIHREFPELRSINISIKKLQPPIEGITGSAGVTWQKEF